MFFGSGTENRFRVKVTKILIYETFVHEHYKSGAGGLEVAWKCTFLHADEWFKIGCKWPLQRPIRCVKKNCTITGLYSEECEGRSEIRKNVNSESASCGTESGGATGESNFAEERGEVATKQDRCERVC